MCVRLFVRDCPLLCTFALNHINWAGLLVSYYITFVVSLKKNFFFFKSKICRDDYAKKYSKKVYIGMAVCKGRGDGIKHEV